MENPSPRRRRRRRYGNATIARALPQSLAQKLTLTTVKRASHQLLTVAVDNWQDLVVALVLCASDAYICFLLAFLLLMSFSFLHLPASR